MSASTILVAMLIYSGLVAVVIVAMMGISYYLGERHEGGGTPYESGMVVTGSARLRFPSRFYLVAMLFVIFDLEAAFIFAWAIAFRELGWPGYGGLLVFVGLLGVALVYEWRVGALDFGPGLPKRALRGELRGLERQRGERAVP